MKNLNALNEFYCDLCGENVNSKKDLPNGWAERKVSRNTSAPYVHICHSCLRSVATAIKQGTNFESNLKKLKIDGLQPEFRKTLVNLLVEDYKEFMMIEFKL